MSQYLLAVYHAGKGPDISKEEMEQSFADVEALNRELQSTGAFVFAGGLLPSESASVVRVTPGGDFAVTDGPFLETKEHMGGFWVIEAPDYDDAMTWARRATVACRLPVEVHPFSAEPPE